MLPILLLIFIKKNVHVNMLYASLACRQLMVKPALENKCSGGTDNLGMHR